MKQVKVTVNEGSPGRTLLVFADAEGAYTWVTEAHADPTIIDQIPDVEHVALLPGEFIEAEMRGYEYDYGEEIPLRLDFVRFAKVQPTENASGALVSIHYGWVHSCIMPLHNYRDADITVVPLLPDECKVDLAVLFKDDEEEKK